MSDSTVRGRFVWHELMTTDTKSAAGFFTKVAGWKTQSWAQNPDYTLFTAGGKQMAGLMTLPADAKAAGAPPSWLTYIGVPQVDDAANQVAALGGKIMRAAADIPTIGRFAVVQDPQGAVFALFTPSGAPGADSAPAVGDFSWHELFTTDWKAALAFYKQMFGWDDMGAMDMGPAGTYQLFGRNGRMLGGMFNKPSQVPVPMWLPYVRVPDSKKTAVTIKTAGGQVVNGPMEVPGGDWIAQGVDLQGATFAVHSLKPAAAKPAASKSAAPKPAAVRKPSAPAKQAASARKAGAAKAGAAKAGAGKASAGKASAGRAAKAARRPVKKRAAGRTKKAARKSAARRSVKTGRRSARKRR